MIWLTADTHFGHASLIETGKRPFRSLSAMERTIIRNINAAVRPKDELYILGDFSYRCSAEHAQELREKIFCQKVHLIPGNHDKDWSRPELAGTFILEDPITSFKCDDGRRIVLSHYPLAVWQGLRRGAIQLHGHIHSGVGEKAPGSYNCRQRERGLLRYDVGVDANGYAPVSLDQVLAWFSGIEPRYPEGL